MMKRETVANADLIIFTRQIASLTGRNIPLSECLELVSADTQNKEFKNVLSSLKTDTGKGETFSAAIAKFPGVFPDVYIKILQPDHMSSDFPSALKTAAQLLETEENFHNKLKTNILYPGSFIIMSILIFISSMIFLLVKIIPTFVKINQDMEAKSLPASLSGIIRVSNFFTYTAIVPVLLVVACVLLILHFATRRAGLFRRLLASLPPIGSVRRQAVIITFFRILTYLLRTGIPLATAMRDAAGILDADKKLLTEQAADDIEKGTPFVESMKKTRIFSPSETWLLKAGEKSGNLPDTFESVIAFRETGMEKRIGVIMSIVPPLLIVAGGLVVLAVWHSIFGTLIGVENALIQNM